MREQISKRKRKSERERKREREREREKERERERERELNKDAGIKRKAESARTHTTKYYQDKKKHRLNIC
jgi:hypothetical protein